MNGKMKKKILALIGAAVLTLAPDPVLQTPLPFLLPRIAEAGRRSCKGIP